MFLRLKCRGLRGNENQPASLSASPFCSWGGLGQWKLSWDHTKNECTSFRHLIFFADPEKNDNGALKKSKETLEKETPKKAHGPTDTSPQSANREPWRPCPKVDLPLGHASQPQTPSEHPNPTTNIGSKHNSRPSSDFCCSCSPTHGIPKRF